MSRTALCPILIVILAPALLAVKFSMTDPFGLQSGSKTEAKCLLGKAFSGVLEKANEMSAAIGKAKIEADKALDNGIAAAGKAVSHVRYAVSRSEDKVCYEVLGCFSLKTPWNRALVPEPDTPENINTRFYLYTRKSPQRFNVTLLPEVDLSGSDFRTDRRTFVITHGFANDGNASWVSDLKDAILKKVDGNVFITDWGNGASKVNYYQVAGNTRIVGAELARLLKHLEHLGKSSSQVHLLGHSLGSQISAYAAKDRRGVGRITAMDPAQPAFEGYDSKVRLDRSDARFVDVVHTNAKPFVPLLGFGMIQPIGHVDFYMNGGADQPGCLIPQLEAIRSLGDIAKIPVTVVAQLVACSHSRSYEYVTEAIESDCKMWGHEVNLAKQLVNSTMKGTLNIVTTHGKCKPGACIPVGLDTPKYPARGAFSVGTASKKPFCVKDNSDDGQDLNELKVSWTDKGR